MEYVQERVTTLHEFTDPVPAAPTDQAAVVVPMTDREHASLAAERVLTTLEDVDPARVVVALRADSNGVAAITEWLDAYDLQCDVCWCNGPRVEELLVEAGLDGPRGKGRDVWLALGVAATEPYVVVHDADVKNYTERHVRRLLFPLDNGYDFSKGYYARVENNRLYGRLFRLFYVPLVQALRSRHNADILEYLASFRYALAGEFAGTRGLVRRLKAQRGWGLEVGTLGDAFAAAGFEASAQVDLGVHEHDHRAVAGPSGLGDMSAQVGEALFHAVGDNGLDVNFSTLRSGYREAAAALVSQYAADARFNGLDYDPVAEREQIAEYAKAVAEPTTDDRLPAWIDAPIDPEEVLAAAQADLEAQAG